MYSSRSIALDVEIKCHQHIVPLLKTATIIIRKNASAVSTEGIS
jgi:hypothetical protein